MATRTGAIARVSVRSGVVEDPRHTYTLQAREPGDLGDTCRQSDGRSAGEGDCRTARVYVSEESHRGIVPMKHSNKDGTLSAESAEGRLRLKENALSPDTYPTQSGTERVPWVGECADRLCLAAIHPREEPDALTSSRPDLYGGTG